MSSPWPFLIFPVSIQALSLHLSGAMVLYDNYSVVAARTAMACWWCFSFTELKLSDFRQEVYGEKRGLFLSSLLHSWVGVKWGTEVRMAFLLMVLVRDECAQYKTCPGLPAWRRRQGFMWQLLSWLTSRWVNWSCELLQCYRAELCTCNCQRSHWPWLSAGDAGPVGSFFRESEMWHRDLCFQDVSSALQIKQLSYFRMCFGFQDVRFWGEEASTSSNFSHITLILTTLEVCFSSMISGDWEASL